MNTAFANLTITLPPWLPALLVHPPACPTDEDKMRLAIRLARENVLHNTNGPFGAAVFRQSDGQLIGVGVNSVLRLHNSVLHAEVLALMVTQMQVQSHTLRQPAHELFTTCDPCAMCLGAALGSGVRRIVCAADREDAERLGFDEGPVFAESYRYLEQRGVVVVRGVLREEACAVLELYRQQGGLAYNG
jgi:tRNA(Arg) A34 adenosine deaminase TadA